MQITKLDMDYLSSWTELSCYCMERPEVEVYAAIERGQCCGVILASIDRIHYVYVPVHERLAGIGEMLVEFIVAQANGSNIRVTVPPENYGALKLFLKAEFNIVGFSMGWDSKCYVMEYCKDRPPVAIADTVSMEEDVADMAKCMYPVEVLPIKIRQANTVES